MQLFMGTDAEDETISTSVASISSASSASAKSLEEKMKSWEASEEEIKAATLGGIVPGTRIGAGAASGEADKIAGGRADAFDVGLYIAFPIMILSCLAVSRYAVCHIVLFSDIIIVVRFLHFILMFLFVSSSSSHFWLVILISRVSALHQPHRDSSFMCNGSYLYYELLRASISIRKNKRQYI